MAKTTRLQDQVKIRGIRRRWLLNSVAIVLLILTLAVSAFAAMLWSYYYSGTADDLMRKATSAANGFRMYTRSDYRAAAQQSVSSYEDKSSLELQFLDTGGAVLYSGNDLTAGSTPGTPDIQQAMRDAWACSVAFKHPSFSSEDEVRMVVSPFGGKGVDIRPCYHVSKERIKKYYPLDLNGMCQKAGAALEDLIEEIIIGPESTQSRPILQDYLTSLDLSALTARVSLSDCPLRGMPKD